MARPESKNPTDAELEVLEVLWRNGPSTLRQIQEALPAELTRASVHTRLQAMLAKKLLKLRHRSKGEGGAVYSAAASREGVVGQMFRRLARMFDGSPKSLMQGLLRGGQLDARDLGELREVLRKRRGKGGE